VRRVLLLAAVWACGCFYGPEFKDGKTKCASHGKQCPDNFVCGANDYCVRQTDGGGAPTNDDTLDDARAEAAPIRDTRLPPDAPTPDAPTPDAPAPDARLPDAPSPGSEVAPPSPDAGAPDRAPDRAPDTINCPAQPECATDAGTRCVNNQPNNCELRDGCVRLTTSPPCAAGLECTVSGKAACTCPDNDCHGAALSCPTPGKLLTCAPDGNGCLVTSKLENCAPGLTCTVVGGVPACR